MVEFFKNIQVDWLGKRKVFVGISVAVMVVGLAALAKKGTFRYGVDFKGGTVAQVRFTDAVKLDDLRSLLPSTAQLMEVKAAGSTSHDVQIQLELDEAKDFSENGGRKVITDALDAKYKDKWSLRSIEVVGSKVGEQFKQQAVTVTLVALAGMLLYIAFRFEWIYGAAAVFAVFHDTLVTLGFFALFDYEINVTVVAALLTLVGYSVNDTIVVFDRVRENLKTRRRDDMVNIMNDSINQTMSRTILTSGLTFLTVLALFLFGGEVINNFAFAMVIGIIVGTYSSIAVASPVVLIYLKATGKLNPPAVKAGSARPAAARSRA